MTWMKHFTYLAFLCTFFEYRGASGTKGKCVCTYGDEVYNLAPLQRIDGKPRFTIHGVGVMSGYEYGYNPCTSFIKTGKQSTCLNDVAICMWAENGGIPVNNGNQSTATCDTDIATGTPQLIYQAALYGPEWHSTVTLICDRTKKTVQEATLVQDPNNAWSFFLSHICACAGGCPLDPVTTKPTPGATKPTPDTSKPTPGTAKPTPDSPWKDIWEPVTIAAGSVIFVFLVISIIIWLKRQNTSNEAGKRRCLIGEEYSRIDESRNSFTKSNDAGNTENLRYATFINSAS